MSNPVVGDTYVYKIECRVSSTGELFDPSPLKVSIILGNGAEDTVTYGAASEPLKLFTRLSKGVYELDYVLPVSGTYRIRTLGDWDSGGVSWPSKSRREVIFEVDPDPHTFGDVPVSP
jgi:hypothetical protein